MSSGRESIVNVLYCCDVVCDVLCCVVLLSLKFGKLVFQVCHNLFLPAEKKFIGNLSNPRTLNKIEDKYPASMG